MIRNTLMNRADQMRSITVIKFETEFPLSVSCGVPGFFHTGGQLDQDDFIAGGSFVRSTVCDLAGDRLCKQR
jgi:hypothetical protein